MRASADGADLVPSPIVATELPDAGLIRQTASQHGSMSESRQDSHPDHMLVLRGQILWDVADEHKASVRGRFRHVVDEEEGGEVRDRKENAPTFWLCPAGY